MDETNAAVVPLPRRLRAPDVPPLFREITRRLGEGPVEVDFGAVEDFDSAALALLRYLRKCAPRLSVVNVRPGVEKAYAAFLEPAAPAACETPPPSRPARAPSSISDRFLARRDRATVFLALLADEIADLASFLRKRRGVYPGEIRNQLYFMGYKSFPIILVLIFIIGVTLTLMVTLTLQTYGVTIYIADFIGVAMIKEIVPLMTGIILSGKVGAAVAAELSTMSVLEEVDALKTMAVVPEKFLMVPRLLAITLAVPFLTGMADFVGVGAGILVGRFHLGIAPRAFINEMMKSVGINDVLVAIVKTMVFGWVIIIGSGFKGLNVGRSAAEVGRATTESVVLSVALIVVIDCIFAFFIY